MKKNIFKSIIIITFIFCNYLPVWSNENIDKIIFDYRIDQNNFLTTNNSLLSISESIKSPCNSNDWIYSTLIPGLGQIKMGDQNRGLKFILSESGLLILSIIGLIIYNLTGISQSNVSTPRNITTIYLGIVASIIGAISVIFLPFIHFANIIDSFAMSKEIECQSK
ncbi:MAG: hypothetical protein H7263_06850 [Candidatus Sericytochromatia bacterium]|nr:hypothetical protein [Candidatus Sericytochromatia bacterium]